jgi:hypothetical protein
MIVYRVTYHDDDSASGTVQQWFASKGAADQGIHDLREQYTGADGETTNCFFVASGSPERINVPASLAGMVRFLNQSARSA